MQPSSAGEVVGFIGLGVMGRPMARRLLQHGHRTIIYSRSPGSVAELAREGAVPAASPAEVATAATIIVTMLPDDAAVEDVVGQSLARSELLRPGTLVIDMSTTAPATAIRMAAVVAAAGGSFVDAPVSGGEQAAVDGTLAIMAGGTAADVARAQPLFDAVGSRTVHVGPHGAGQMAKACNQLVVLGTIQVVAEALLLAKAAGVDPAMVRTALLGGLASSRVLDALGRRMLERDFAPGGRAVFHGKDIAIIRETAARSGVPVPAFEAAAASLETLVDRGGGDLDHSALITVLEDAVQGPATPGQTGDAAGGRAAFSDADRARLFNLPGREWRLVLGPDNSETRRLTMAIATFPAGSAPGGHIHPLEEEVVYVLSGHGELVTPAGSVALSPGVAYHVPAGLEHGAVAGPDGALELLCVFTPPVIPGSYDPIAEVPER